MKRQKHTECGQSVLVAGSVAIYPLGSVRRHVARDRSPNRALFTSAVEAVPRRWATPRTIGRWCCYCTAGKSRYRALRSASIPELRAGDIA
jgi:hypothetical protein